MYDSSGTDNLLPDAKIAEVVVVGITEIPWITNWRPKIELPLFFPLYGTAYY